VIEEKMEDLAIDEGGAKKKKKRNRKKNKNIIQ
jgi:hypothetical protein